MKTIVLVHGAWLDASSWDAVVPALKAAGHDVVVVKLPGHGNDQTPYKSITLNSYVDTLKSAIGSKTNIILVGHSMGGIVISQVAEQIPDQISKLVYIAAFLPRNGESLLQLGNSPENKESLLAKYLRPDEKEGSADIAKEGIRESFVADAPEAIAAQAATGLKPEPLVPMVTPLTLTDAKFGRVNKVFVYTMNDRAVTYTLQQQMAKNAGITRTYGLPSSHTAFFSMPGVVAAILNKEVE